MNKRLISLLILMLFLFCTSASAAPFTFIDKFSNISNSSTAAYRNMTTRSISGSTSEVCGSFSGAATAENGHSASVTYSLTGVSELRLGLYSPNGCFVQNSQLFGWTLGHAGAQNLGAFLAAPRAQICTGPDNTRGVYSFINGQYYQLFWDSNNYYTRFVPTEENPSAIASYGVSVYADNKPIELSRVGIKQLNNANLICEDFCASIPSGTGSIRIEINDVASFPIYGRTQSIPNSDINLIGLGYVELSGAYIQPEEPVQKEEELLKKPESSSSAVSSKAPKAPQATAKIETAPSSSEAKSSSSSKSSSAVASAASPRASSSKPASQSKFEGSAPTPKSSSQSSKPEVSASSESIISGPIVYQIEKTASRNGTAISGSVIYILLASVAVVMVFLKGNK